MVRINLLPVRVSKKKEAGKQQLLLFALLLVAGILGNGYWNGDRARDLSVRQRQLAKTQADVAALERIIGEVSSIRAEQKALQEKLDVLDSLKKGRSGPVRVLDELATLMPKRVWLRKLAEKGGKVTFEGSAGTIEDVSALMSALKQSTHFKGIDLKRTDAKLDAKAGSLRTVEFTIEATVDYAAGVPGVAGVAKTGG
jgi:type IV pilus assembly protein PilN